MVPVLPALAKAVGLDVLDKCRVRLSLDCTNVELVVLHGAVVMALVGSDSEALVGNKAVCICVQVSGIN